MRKYLLTKYYGRSGNNIIQLLNHLNNIKDEKNVIFEAREHKLFKLKINPLTLNVSKTNGNYTHSKNITCNNFLLFDKPLLLSELKEIFTEFIESKINIHINNKHDIGIHIRSGDIFNTIGKTHPLYLQPPLYYYKKIIDKNINKKIVIVFENKKNPVINKLIEIYKNNKNIIFQSSSIENDIKTLSSCKTLVFSNGSFCLLPYIFSNTITKIIIPDFLENNKWFSFDNNETEIIKLPNYIPYGKWKNTLEQQKIMVEYKL